MQFLIKLTNIEFLAFGFILLHIICCGRGFNFPLEIEDPLFESPFFKRLQIFIASDNM